MVTTDQPSFQGNLFSHISRLPAAWKEVFQQKNLQKNLGEINAFLEGQLALGAQIYPPNPLQALLDLEPQDVKVVILGQDPYHGPGQAHGLAFSVPEGCRIPPSLRNIFAELALEYPDHKVRQSSSLLRWARQGVLLLNTVLTVEQGKPGSHATCGWAQITDALLQRVLQDPCPKVFLLWGNHAQAKKKLIQGFSTGTSCLILEANHPSPLSARRPPRPFIGCGHFRMANDWLQLHGETIIDWLGLQS